MVCIDLLSAQFYTLERCKTIFATTIIKYTELVYMKLLFVLVLIICLVGLYTVEHFNNDCYLEYKHCSHQCDVEVYDYNEQYNQNNCITTCRILFDACEHEL